MIDPQEVNEFVEVQFPAMYRQGIRCTRLGDGTAEAVWIHDPSQLRPGDYISGPTQFSLADAALWFLAFTVVGLEPMAVTSDLSINFLRPAVGGDLHAEANLISLSRRRLLGEVRLWVEAEDRLVSHATGTYALPTD